MLGRTMRARSKGPNRPSASLVEAASLPPLFPDAASAAARSLQFLACQMRAPTATPTAAAAVAVTSCLRTQGHFFSIVLEACGAWCKQSFAEEATQQVPLRPGFLPSTRPTCASVRTPATFGTELTTTPKPGPSGQRGKGERTERHRTAHNAEKRSKHPKRDGRKKAMCYQYTPKPTVCGALLYVGLDAPRTPWHTRVVRRVRRHRVQPKQVT